VPGFLPDIPEVRKEVAQYLTSAHRADETVGAVLDALAGSGLEQNTLVMFLSDNGMAFPFAKANCYLNSTRTPWIIRWPGRTTAGAADSTHFISCVDFMPTVLDAARLPALPGGDGFSLLPLLQKGRAPWRDSVVTVFHETSAPKRYEMRAVQNAGHLYIFNAWADGQEVFRNESQGGLTFNAMTAAAAANPEIAERVRFFLYRCPEELYDLRRDPQGLRNLAGDRRQAGILKKMRAQLGHWMSEKADPIRATFEKKTGVIRG
jgi:N-sulfoglucosamine sulfohydrolase